MDIPFDKYANNFTFYVNGNPFHINRIIADILSPAIRELHFSDATIDNFSIEVSCADYFQDFLNLAQYHKKETDLDHLKNYIEYFYAVGNTTEAINIRSDLFDESFNTHNIISLLKSIIEMGDILQYEKDDYSDLIKQMISYIAQRFDEIEKKQIASLPIDILEEILKHKSLTIKDEDTLLDFILHLAESDQTYSSLFEYVNFQYVSDELFQFFINEFDINYINQSIWESFCSKFLQNNKNTNRRYKDTSLSDKVKFDNVSIFCSDDEQPNINRKIISQLSSSSSLDGIDEDNDNDNDNDFDRN